MVNKTRYIKNEIVTKGMLDEAVDAILKGMDSLDNKQKKGLIKLTLKDWSSNIKLEI